MWILFPFQSYREQYKYKTLDWISKVGLAVSVVALIITIIHHLKEK